MHPRAFLLCWAAAFGLLALVWIGLFALQIGVETPVSRELGQLHRSKARFALSRPSPKIVLLGGSSVLYGLRAEDIERSTGRPAANMAISMALGADYNLRAGRAVLRPGDTAVLSLEFEQYEDSCFNNPIVEEQVLANDPRYLLSLPFPDQARWVFGIADKQLLRACLIRLGAPPRPSHGGYVLSPWGDIVNNRPADQTPAQKDRIATRRPPNHARLLPADTKIWPLLLSFRDWCAANHVRLVVVFPPYLQPETPGEAANLDRLFTVLLDFYDRNGFVRLGTPWESLRPRAAFFDNEYHLFREGGEERTRVFLKEFEAAPVRP